MKKILSLILCFVTVCAFSVSAYADDVKAQVTNDGGNLGFITSLNISDSDVDGNAPLTRGELAKMFYRILINKNVPDYSYFDISFTDVTEEITEPVRAVAALGIMNGIGSDVFGVDYNVTYAQAVKAIVSFLGYSVKAEALGGWPSGYYTTAASLGLLAGSPGDINSVLTYNGAADLFRYAAEAPIMESYGNDTYIVDGDVTFISHYYDIVRGSGIITANSITNFDGEPLSYGQIAINGETMNLTENSVPVADLLGYSVELFCTFDGGKYTVVYYELNDTDAVTVSDKDIISASYDKYVYETADGKEKKINIDSGAVIVYNNTTAASYNMDVLNPFASDLYDGYVTCIDNSGDSNADVVFIEAYETMVVGSVRNSVISSKVRYGKSIDINDYDKNSINILNVMGHPILPEEIATDDILTYYRDLEGKVTRIYVTVESSTGKLDYITKEGTLVTALSVGGIEYECSKGVSLNGENDSLVPGMYVMIYFDRYGRVSDLEAAVFEGEVGYLTDYRRGNGLDDTYMVKIFCANSRFEVFSLAKKVRINDSHSINPEDFQTLCGTDASGKIKRQVIKFSANSDGEITKVYLADPSVNADGEYVSDFFIYRGYDGTVSHRFTDVFNCFDLQLYPGGSTKTFVVPTDANRDFDGAYKVGYSFTDGATPRIIAYGDDKNSSVPVAIVYATDSDTSANLRTTYNIFAVSKVVNRLDENGDEVTELSGWYRKSAGVGALGSFAIDDVAVFKESLGGRMPEEGDIITYSKTADDKINRGMFVFDKSENSIGTEFAGNPNRAYNTTGSRFVYGDIIYSDGTNITIEIISDSGNITYETYPISRFTQSGATFVKENDRVYGTYRNTALSDIYDRHSYGEQCSKALVFLGGKYWVTGFIFTD